MSFSDTDMKPSVFWQSFAFYRGQRDTGGLPVPSAYARVLLDCNIKATNEDI